MDSKDMTPTARRGRFLRYGVTTLGAATANLSLYWLLLGPAGWSAPIANLTAAVIVIAARTVVYELWIWGRGPRGSNTLLPRLLAYFGVSALGVGLSTIVAAVLQALSASDQTLLAWNLSIYTLVWIGRFGVLERLRGNDRSPAPTGPPSSLELGVDRSDPPGSSAAPLTGGQAVHVCTEPNRAPDHR